jgi:GNAT superfamily N-acetyltransferase
MTIIELTEETQFLRTYPLLAALNPSLTYEQFTQRLTKIRTQAYRCIAYTDEMGEYLGICGFWYGTRFWCGDFIDIDHFVVREGIRAEGIGKQMLAWIEAEAARLGCDQTGLDCYVTHDRAHRFYFREGYIIKGYHFTKPCLSV